MGKYINHKKVVDTETGEIIREVNWVGYDGFNDKGYRYRKNSEQIRYYFDAVPKLSKDAFMLLILLGEIMNNENVLVYRVERKSKFSTILYKAYDKEQLKDKIRYKFGINKFDTCWKELSIHCLKRVQYRTCKAWAINPAIISKCKVLPYWLYDEFEQYINPYLSANAINKFHNRLDEMRCDK